jgi:hypothetical protein
MFGGINLNIVEPGTVVGHGPNNEPFVVTETSAVFRGSQAWVTQKMYDAIKAKTVALKGGAA